MSALECQICLQSMVGRNPRALPCLHTFCESCLSNIVTRAQSTFGPPLRDCIWCTNYGMQTVQLNGFCSNCNRRTCVPVAGPICSTIRCPTCRVKTTLPQDGVIALPLNFMINQMNDLRSDVQKCHLCKTGMAKFGCETCLKILCEKCKDRHDSVPAFSGHLVRQLNVDGASRCAKHQNEAIYVCLVCIARVCIECVLSDEHQAHKEKVVEYKTWMDSEKKKLVNLQTQMKPKLNVLQANLKEMKQYHENIEKTQSMVNDTANRKIKQKIENDRSVMTNKLTTEQKRVAAAIKQMEQVSSNGSRFCALTEENLNPSNIVRDMVNAVKKGEAIKLSTAQIQNGSKTWFNFVPETFITFGTLKTSGSKPLL